MQHAVRHSRRFTLSLRDVEDLVTESDLEVFCETVRRWELKFGGTYAWWLRSSQPGFNDRWHFDDLQRSIDAGLTPAVRRGLSKAVRFTENGMVERGW